MTIRVVRLIRSNTEDAGPRQILAHPFKGIMKNKIDDPYDKLMEILPKFWRDELKDILFEEGFDAVVDRLDEWFSELSTAEFEKGDKITPTGLERIIGRKP